MAAIQLAALFLLTVFCSLSLCRSTALCSFLHRPSTGLSPETRREIWNIIEKRKRRSRGANGKAIVITTHAMEEADALCDRIGIMADGGLQSLGSAAHLKTRFGEGFKLTLHLQHEFERAGVREIIRNESRSVGASSHRDHPLAKHDVALVGDDADAHVLLLDADQQARAQQHCNMLRFITRMAPHAALSSIEGKNIQLRLHPDRVSSSSSVSVCTDGASSSVVDDSHSMTSEVLSVFNVMELHRHALLPSYDIEEWGLTQSSLEEVRCGMASRQQHPHD
jgi:ABC-type glutathione transport system ATPase component